MSMKNVNAILVRYFGADWNRYHCLQRGDGHFWTGDGWSKILDCAKVYRQHRDAQRACVALQRQQYGGKPMRTFRLEVAVALVADDVHEINTEQLADFIGKAVRIDIESSVFNDGPVEGSYVQLQLRLATLEETDSARKRF
jgi:hypothetical protein